VKSCWEPQQEKPTGPKNNYIGYSKPQPFFVYFSFEFDGAVVDDLTLKQIVIQVNTAIIGYLRLSE